MRNAGVHAPRAPVPPRLCGRPARFSNRCLNGFPVSFQEFGGKDVNESYLKAASRPICDIQDGSKSNGSGAIRVLMGRL